MPTRMVYWKYLVVEILLFKDTLLTRIMQVIMENLLVLDIKTNGEAGDLFLINDIDFFITTVQECENRYQL